MVENSCLTLWADLILLESRACALWPSHPLISLIRDGEGDEQEHEKGRGVSGTEGGRERGRVDTTDRQEEQIREPGHTTRVQLPSECPLLFDSEEFRSRPLEMAEWSQISVCKHDLAPHSDNIRWPVVEYRDREVMLQSVRLRLVHTDDTAPERCPELCKFLQYRKPV